MSDIAAPHPRFAPLPVTREQGCRFGPNSPRSADIGGDYVRQPPLKKCRNFGCIHAARGAAHVSRQWTTMKMPRQGWEHDRGEAVSTQGAS